ncbi:MAG: hypothetical protein ACI4UY_13465 [Kiritimatiellia bacterium]
MQTATSTASAEEENGRCKTISTPFVTAIDVIAASSPSSGSPVRPDDSPSSPGADCTIGAWRAGARDLAPP